MTSPVVTGPFALGEALAERGLAPRDLVSLTRVSSPVLSPDGGRLVFVERTVDLEGDGSGTALYLRDLRTRDMRPPQRISPEGWNVSAPAFSPPIRASSWPSTAMSRCCATTACRPA